MNDQNLHPLKIIYLAKEALKSDDGKTFFEIEKDLIALDNSEAYFLLGRAYQTADSDFRPFKKSEKKAIEFYTKAFEYGNLDSGIKLYSILAFKKDAHSKNQARKVLIYCAERDERMAFELASFIIENEKQNIETALIILEHLKNWWFENQTRVLNLLGKIYCEGKVVDQDISKGLESYKISKKRGCELAIRELGRIYVKGKYGVPIDEKKAIENFTLLEKSKNDILSEEAKHYLNKLNNHLKA